MNKIATLTAITFGLTLITAPAVSQEVLSATSKTKWPECYCTDRYGKRHEIGDIICLTVDSRSYRAKCIMAQNNPFWRDMEQGCLSSSIEPKQTPFPNDYASVYQ